MRRLVIVRQARAASTSGSAGNARPTSCAEEFLRPRWMKWGWPRPTSNHSLPRTQHKASARGGHGFFWKASRWRREESHERAPPRWETETRAFVVVSGQEAARQLRFAVCPEAVWWCVSISVSNGPNVELPVLGEPSGLLDNLPVSMRGSLVLQTGVSPGTSGTHWCAK
jgi:hypothetical protein